MKFAQFILIPVLALSFLGMARKSADVAIRFHLEANARDGEPFSLPAKFHNPDRDGFVEKLPAVSEREISAIYPVAVADGTFGCVFKLDPHGAIALRSLSIDRRGGVLVAFVVSKSGPHQVAEMLIDKPINDGIIYLPSGLTAFEIGELRKKFPIIGQSGKPK